MEVSELRLDEQKLFPNSVGVFPYIYGGKKDATLSSALQWVQENKVKIEKTLVQHGAILFRNFPLENAKAFSDFVESFGFENLPYIGGAAPRKQVVGDVYTANEAPPDAVIPFHHEMAQVKEYPKKLFFYGDVAPDTGGETPIVLSNEVYKAMVLKYPEFVEKLEKQELIYTRIMPTENDETSPQGRGWKATYNVTTREELEAHFKKIGKPFEWLPNGDVKVLTVVPPGIQADERTGNKVWFNSIVAVFTGWNDSRHVGAKCIQLGDGSYLDAKDVHGCRDIMDELCVNHRWEHGDVILIDNRLAMHGRRPFTGQRKVYAYLTKT